MSNKEYEQVLDKSELGCLLQDSEVYLLDSSVKSKMKQKILGNIRAESPVGGITVRGDKNQWISVTNNISVQILHQDQKNKVQAALWRLKPGTVVPGHYHNHDEDCLVLEGEISFAGHTLYPGDYHRMEQGTEHPDMFTSTGALLYLKHDIHEDLSWLNG